MLATAAVLLPLTLSLILAVAERLAVREDDALVEPLLTAFLPFDEAADRVADLVPDSEEVEVEALEVRARLGAGSNTDGSGDAGRFALDLLYIGQPKAPHVSPKNVMHSLRLPRRRLVL